MAKNAMQTGVKPVVGTGVPGDASRARMNESQGVKVTAPSASEFGTAPKLPKPNPATASAGSGMVMPVDHPSSTTTRTVGKGGTL